eukprot:CAMPEP_0179181482 /NCGR_PEP_ID=MMETSP0796-20121207/89884_1 /TAXON_ID=73915 /ORGANISM="Pyrodinium bahamense, Strain pbaha01" /LENGTH=37 /DNA_ID= /DNA_START= /DNA_END= /DNA_ORIENTATION=
MTTWVACSGAVLVLLNAGDSYDADLAAAEKLGLFIIP